MSDMPSSSAESRPAPQTGPGSGEGGRFAAVVLAGGAARRMGGGSKPARPVAGVSMLCRVLAAVEEARPRIVVGPLELAGALPRGTSLTIEHPPGGGPVAATAAGLGLLAASEVATVALLAADLPFLGPETVALLRASIGPAQDGAVLLDERDRPQWLCGVWRRDALVAELDRLGRPRGRGMRELLGGLRFDAVRPPETAGPPPWFDCDTEEDLRQAEEWAHEHSG